MEKENPLIIVFYLDSEMMKIKEIIQPFVESINNMIKQKESNVMAFFLPTKGEERVECINPKIVDKADMDKIYKMIEDIKETYSIGINLDLPDEEIIIDNKPCECGKNPDGSCKC